MSADLSAGFTEWHLLHVHIWPNSHTKLCKTLVQSSPRVWEGVLVSLQITYHKHRIWLNAVHTLCNEVFAGYSRPIGAAFFLLGADWLEWWACSAQPAGPVPRVLWSSASNSWNSADDMSHSHAHTHSCILSDTQTKCKHIGYIDTHIYIYCIQDVTVEHMTLSFCVSICSLVTNGYTSLSSWCTNSSLSFQ